jgi:chromosome segregation ATPase
MLAVVWCVEGVDHVHKLGENKEGNIHFNDNRHQFSLAMRHDLERLNQKMRTWVANRTGESINDPESRSTTPAVQVHNPVIATNAADQDKIDERNALAETLRNLQAQLDALLADDQKLTNEIAAVLVKIDDLNAEIEKLQANGNPGGMLFQFQESISSAMLSGYKANPELRNVEKELSDYKARLEALLQKQEMLKTQIEDFQGRVDAVVVALNAINDELMRAEEERQRIADQNVKLAEEERRRRALEEEMRALNNQKFDGILRNLQGSHEFEALRAKVHLLFAMKKFHENKRDELIQMIEIVSSYSDKLNKRHSFLGDYVFDSSGFTLGDCNTFGGFGFTIPMANGIYDINETFKLFIDKNQGNSINNLNEQLNRMLDKFSSGSYRTLLDDMMKLDAIMRAIDAHFTL